MALPKPRPGLVIGYDFLFREQADADKKNAANLTLLQFSLWTRTIRMPE